MNKNTLLTFLLIIVVISFFSSKFYYEKILRIPHPSSVSRQEKTIIPEKEKKNPVPVETKKTQEQIIKNDIPSQKINQEVQSVIIDESATFDTIIVETEKMIVYISEKGARIISIKTKDYRVNAVLSDKPVEENPYIELIEDPGLGGANLKINNESFDNAVFKCDEGKNKLIIKGNDSDIVNFKYLAIDGNTIDKKFTFHSNDYVIGLEVNQETLDGKQVVVGWLCGIAESDAEKKGQNSAYDIRKIHMFDGKNVFHISDKKPDKNEETGYYEWVGLTSKYFLTAIIGERGRNIDVNIESYKTGDTTVTDKKKIVDINYRFSTSRFAAGPVEKYRLYVGPAKIDELRKQNIKLEKVLFGGWKWFLRADIWFPVICEFVLRLLIALQKILMDYGLVIIVLTILSRVVTYPLTHSSTKSMNRMRDLQPKINEIRTKYKNDAKKMNQKVMELYKKEGVNPLNPGCLPMFLQMPVFISLFIVLQKAIELRGQGTWIVPWIHDLSKPEILPLPFINPLPFEIPMYGRNIALLPIIMAILTYFQNKATIKDPNQKMMIYFMPVFMLLLFNNFPSGLVLYWTFSSALGLAQQYWTDAKKKRQNQPVLTAHKQKA